MNMDRFTLNRDEAYLLTVDVQERLAPVIAHTGAVSLNVKRMLEGAAVFRLPGSATEQYPKGLGPTLPAIREAIDACGYPVFTKTVFTAYTPEVAAHVEASGRTSVIVTGMETHVCVFQTVRDLLAAGYRVFIPDDAVGSRSEESRVRALAVFTEMGACVTRTETILFDLLKDSKSPEFKTISALVK